MLETSNKSSILLFFRSVLVQFLLPSVIRLVVHSSIITSLVPDDLEYKFVAFFNTPKTTKRFLSTAKSEFDYSIRFMV